MIGFGIMVKILVGHGDGFGPGEIIGYKFLKKVFRNPVYQWLFGIFAAIYPGMGIASYFSRQNGQRQWRPIKTTNFGEGQSG